jgi:hypothetical protein
MWHVGSRGDYGAIAPKPSPGRRWLRRHDPRGASLVADVLSGTHPLLPHRDVAATFAEDVVPLALRAAAEVPPATSGDGEVCSLLLVNDGPAAARLSWVAGDGELHVYAIVPPGGRVGQVTYIGHVWELSSIGADTVLGRVVACSGLGVVSLPKVSETAETVTLTEDAAPQPSCWLFARS